MSSTDLARTLDRLQTERNAVWHALARRLELAQAAQNVASCRAVAPADSVLRVAGGVALFLGPGNPLSQALAMGLTGPVVDADLDAIEAHLRRDGGVPQFELCPAADPSWLAALAERRYRVQEFQLTWVRPMAGPPVDVDPPAGVDIREVSPDQRSAFVRTVMAGFFESRPEDVPADALASLQATAEADGARLFGAFIGARLVGGGSLFVHDGVAVLAGAGVPPEHRGRGIQGALIRARLAEAARHGCDLACSGTAPGSASQRNMERHGFTVAYPKIVLLAQPAGGGGGSETTSTPAPPGNP